MVLALGLPHSKGKQDKQKSQPQKEKHRQNDQSFGENKNQNRQHKKGDALEQQAPKNHINSTS